MTRSALFALALACFASACSRPCSSPIRYRLGTIDSRFRISERELRAAIRAAEDVWEDSTKLELFRYADDGNLVVNLVYDERQTTTQNNLQRKYTIEKSGSLADDARAKLEAARARHEAALRDYRSILAAHETRVAAHNREVATWNARGGAPSADFAAMQREEAAIESSAADLDRKLAATNALADHANQLAARYNDLATEVNSNIEAINTTAGHEFKQGVFVRDGAGVRINVFEFLDRIDLVHVLAHEMGHALGLDHNSNPASILFGSNSSQSARLSAEDLAALKEKCRL